MLDSGNWAFPWTVVMLSTCPAQQISVAAGKILLDSFTSVIGQRAYLMLALLVGVNRMCAS